MKKFFGFLLLSIMLIVGGVFLALGPLYPTISATTLFSKLTASTVHTEVQDTELIEKMVEEEEVVLLSLATQGLEERKTSNENFLGLFDIPGTGKTKFIRYEFEAKLGIEGQDVVIEETGPGEFRVTVPSFIFIGHDNVRFRTAAEVKGVLSWVTPEKSEFDIANEILSDDKKKAYIKQYEDLLHDQAVAHYTQIVSSIDPSVKLEFAFAGDEDAIAE